MPRGFSTLLATTTHPNAEVVDDTEENFMPPKVTNTIKCGLRNDNPSQQGSPGQPLYDPENKNRFINSNTVAGNNTSQGEFPWQVSLRYIKKKTPFCGGTLINSWTVLTAAHCMYEVYPTFERTHFAVALGWQKSTGNKILREDAKFGKMLMYINTEKKGEGHVFIHPDYKGDKFNPKTKEYMANDIAIIVLKKEIMFHENADSGTYWDDHEKV